MQPFFYLLILKVLNSSSFASTRYDLSEYFRIKDLEFLCFPPFFSSVFEPQEEPLRGGRNSAAAHARRCASGVKAIGCSSLRGGGGELGTLKILTYGSN